MEKSELVVGKKYYVQRYINSTVIWKVKLMGITDDCAIVKKAFEIFRIPFVQIFTKV